MTPAFAQMMGPLHFFNHQARHRAQVHAMLTAAGAKPGATVLAVIPQKHNM